MKKVLVKIVAFLITAPAMLSLSGCSNLFYVSRDLVGDKGDFLIGEKFSSGTMTVTLTDWLGNETVFTEYDMTFDSSNFDSSKAGEYEIFVVINSIDYKFSYTVFVYDDEDLVRPLE